MQTGPGGGNAVQNDTYTYNALGSLATRKNKMGPNPLVIENLGYDLLQRLTSSEVTAPATQPTKTYGYDALGNITGKTGVGSGAANSYSYSGGVACNVNAGPHAVRSIAGISGSFCYDGNGNLTSDPGFPGSPYR